MGVRSDSPPGSVAGLSARRPRPPGPELATLLVPPGLRRVRPWPVGSETINEDAASPYRGTDRRGLIAAHATSVSTPGLALLALAGLVIPVVLAILMSTSEIPTLTAARAMSNAAALALVLAGVLAWVRWRLLGDAHAGLVGPPAILLALVMDPTMQLGTRSLAPRDPVAVGFQLVALAAATAALALAVHSPDIRADLRPVRFGGLLLVTVVLMGIALGLSPARAFLLVHEARAGYLAVAVAAGAATVAALSQAHRRGRALLSVIAIMLLTLTLACVALAVGSPPPGSWTEVVAPASLLVGGAALAVVVVADLRVALEVVRADIRGRRRWEAAESALTLHNRLQQGQEHDIKAALSAVSAALSVLQQHRDRLETSRMESLLSATREQVEWLGALLVRQETAPSRYQVSELLDAVTALRRAQPQPVTCVIEPGLAVIGRPDHLAIVLNNLLANAAVHAPMAAVTVTARGARDGTGREVVEIVVADNGPGVPDCDLERAFERGWSGSPDPTGQGLGLFQCRELLRVAGGDIVLAPTNPQAGEGHRGLSAHLWLPAIPAAPVPTVTEARPLEDPGALPTVI